MRQIILSSSGAALLLLSIACNEHDPMEVDASIVHDASTVPDGATASGGATGTGGAPGTGGATGSGGQMGGSGGASTGTGGTATGGSTGTGGTGDAGQVCGGIAALPCPKGLFCEYPAGECSGIADATGLCTAPSQACDLMYRPVCGCDGKTYGNDCARRGAGVSKLGDGECSTIGKLCGGIAGFACGKGQFCDLSPGDCGTIADGAGTCAMTGAGIGCEKIYRPVCGCDGLTYGNDCERQVAGVSKRAEGECPTTGKLCGGIAGFACGKGQFCDLAVGDCGTIADGAGTCVTTGANIACPAVYRPVCGCNGKTYGNDCERQAAGISKANEGSCPGIDGGIDR